MPDFTCLTLSCLPSEYNLVAEAPFRNDVLLRRHCTAWTSPQHRLVSLRLDIQTCGHELVAARSAHNAARGVEQLQTNFRPTVSALDAVFSNSIVETRSKLLSRPSSPASGTRNVDGHPRQGNRKASRMEGIIWAFVRLGADQRVAFVLLGRGSWA